MADELRSILRAMLPERAFLHRARGEAAFVTNAQASILPALEEAGFICRRINGLIEISPGAGFLLAYEESHPDPKDDLSLSLLRFRGRTPCPRALTLFAVGIRLEEHAAPGEAFIYDRDVRRLAALCLRENLGGAYACACLNANLERSI